MEQHEKRISALFSNFEVSGPVGTSLVPCRHQVRDQSGRPEMQGGCKDVHPGFGSTIHACQQTSDGGWMERREKNMCLV